MLEELKRWPEKLKDGWQVVHDCCFQCPGIVPKNIKKIVFIGMGGSGVAGHIMKAFLDKKSTIPSFVIDGPHLPSFIDTGTLVIVMSYSGDTWETVSCFEALAQKRIPLLVLTHGGRAAAIAEERNIPIIFLPKSKTPRSALGNFLGILLGLFDLAKILGGKGILASFQKQVEKYVPKFADTSYFDEFVTIGKDFEDFYVWGVQGDSSAVAYRAATQFNENSKARAVFSPFPELCHNLLVGFTTVTKKPLVVRFSTSFLTPNLEKAAEIAAELLQQQGAILYKPPVLGDTWEEQLFHIILWSDFASCYLAMARGVEIVPVSLIDTLKAKQREKNIL